MDNQNKKFDAQLKHSANVKREGFSDERGTLAANKLVEVAKILSPRDQIEYIGSAAVHIYKSDVAGEIYFAAQTGTLANCPEAIAQAAFKDLAGSAMEHFGRKRPVTRSGF